MNLPGLSSLGLVTRACTTLSTPGAWYRLTATARGLCNTGSQLVQVCKDIPKAFLLSYVKMLVQNFLGNKPHQYLTFLFIPYEV